MPFGEESDRTSTAVRCVAAAEIYKLTGHLPAWARPLPAQLGDAVVLCTEIRMQGTGRHRSFGDPHEVVCRPQAIGRGSRLAWLAPNHKRGVTNKRVLWGFIKPE